MCNFRRFTTARSPVNCRMQPQRLFCFPLEISCLQKWAWSRNPLNPLELACSCPSVRLSQLSTTAAACGGFAAVGPAGRRYRLIAARPAPSSNGFKCAWRPWAGSLLEARVVGCWCGCVSGLDSGARCRQLSDLHINSMTYTLFFIPDYQFQKSIFMFP